MLGWVVDAPWGFMKCAYSIAATPPAECPVNRRCDEMLVDGEFVYHLLFSWLAAVVQGKGWWELELVGWRKTDRPYPSPLNTRPA